LQGNGVGQTATGRVTCDMHEMVEALWDDTDNLQEDMAKVMALARANKSTTAKTLQSVTSLKTTTAALATAVNDLIPVVWRQGTLLQDMQRDHVKFCKEMLPVLTSTVHHCNTTLEEMQWDHVKFCQNIVEIDHQVMKPTMASPTVELKTFSIFESGALYVDPSPRKKVLVGLNNESGALTVLHPPPCNNVSLDHNNELGATNVLRSTPHENVFFGCEGGPVVSQGFGGLPSWIFLCMHLILSSHR
jgi:hypothetical protein